MVKYRDIHTFFYTHRAILLFIHFHFHILIAGLLFYNNKTLNALFKVHFKIEQRSSSIFIAFCFQLFVCVCVCLCVAQQIFILIIPKLRSALISWNFHVSCESSIFLFKCCCCCLEEFSLKFSDLRHFNSSDLSSVDLRQFSWCVW